MQCWPTSPVFQCGVRTIPMSMRNISQRYLSTQHMSSRWDGTQVGLSRAGQSERIQAKKARVRRLRSSEALPSHNRLRLGHVHSRKHKAGTSSGVRADLALLAHHSFTITGGTVESYRNKTNLDLVLIFLWRCLPLSQIRHCKPKYLHYWKQPKTRANSLIRHVKTFTFLRDVPQ